MREWTIVYYKLQSTNKKSSDIKNKEPFQSVDVSNGRQAVSTEASPSSYVAVNDSNNPYYNPAQINPYSLIGSRVAHATT